MKKDWLHGDTADGAYRQSDQPQISSWVIYSFYTHISPAGYLLTFLQTALHLSLAMKMKILQSEKPIASFKTGGMIPAFN